MKRKNSLLFVQVFMLSVLIASPFLVKQAFPKKEKIDVDITDIVYDEDISSKEEEDTNSNENKDSNVNSNTNSNKNEEDKKESNENSNKTSNTNSNSASNVKPDYIQKGEFAKVEDSYFKDALFIGDSRTVGIKEYGKLKEATYFCDTGMSIYNIYSRKVSIPDVGKVDLKKLLSTKKYGKIYIMLGINEIGYPLDNSAKKFKEVVQYIRDAQPEAIIVIQANLHVTKEKSDSDSTFSNKRIDKYNKKLADIADGKNVYYLDANEIFDDGSGNLKASYTFDNVHIYAKYYVNWTDYLKDHAIKFEIKKEESSDKEESTNQEDTSKEDNKEETENNVEENNVEE